MGSRFWILLILLPLALSMGANAQESVKDQEKKAAESEFKPHSTIGLVVSHAHVFAGLDEDGKKKVLVLPSWGIDYTYHFSPKWAVGLHTDIILESFKVESHDGGETLERSYPIAPALLAIYKANHHWSFMIGAGGEFAKEENFFTTRLGLEYGAEIRNGWEVFGSLTYDIKWKGYDSWVVGLGISKAFGQHHKHD